MENKQNTKRLGRLAYRLTLTGLIVLGAFNFGSIFYMYARVHLPQKEELRTFASILNSTAAKDLELTINGRSFTIKSDQLKTWLETYQRSYSNQEDVRISSEKLDDYLRSLAMAINVEPVNANIQFESGKATTFRAPVEGSRLDIGGSALAIIQALRNGESS